jgi:putative lipoic acid-binding regulatory protein
MFNTSRVDNSTSVRVHVEQKDIKAIEASKVYGEMLEQFKKNVLDVGTFTFLEARGRWMIHMNPTTDDYFLTAKIRINNKDIELTKNITYHELKRVNSVERGQLLIKEIYDLVLERISKEVTYDCVEVLLNERKYIR